jgi:ComEC/Rec2-related protein
MFARRFMAASVVFGLALAFLVFDSHLAAVDGWSTRLVGARRFEGRILNVRDGNITTRILVGDLTFLVAGERVRAPGTVQINLDRGYVLETGDAVTVGCRLAVPKSPVVTADQVVKDRIVGTCSSVTDFSVSGRRFGIVAVMTKFREALVLAIGRALPSPQAELGAGLVLGTAAAPLPADVIQDFRDTGTSHIVAASGYNVSVVAAWCLTALFALGLRRRRALIGSLVLIWAYVVLAGAGPPVVRAGVMGSLVALASVIGRETRPLHALVISAAGMLALEPELLVFDIGFELTVAATAGLMLIGPRFALLYPRLFDGGVVRRLLAETVAATIATLPIILWRFGSLSLVTLFANVLIVPAVPLAMALAVVSAVCGLFGPPVATLGLIAWLPLTYILEAARRIAAVPFASVSLGTLPWWVAVLGYGLVALWLWPREPSVVQEPLKGFEGWNVESV